MKVEKLLLTKRDVGYMLSMSTKTIDRHVKAGTFPMPRRNGNKDMWRKEEIINYIENLTNQTTNS